MHPHLIMQLHTNIEEDKDRWWIITNQLAETKNYIGELKIPLAIVNWYKSVGGRVSQKQF